jgi:hypothetical protein
LAGPVEGIAFGRGDSVGDTGVGRGVCVPAFRVVEMGNGRDAAVAKPSTIDCAR